MNMKEKMDKVQELVCWESIAYCCHSSKGCPALLGALKVLGITPEQYEEWKKDMNTVLVERIEDGNL